MSDPLFSLDQLQQWMQRELIYPGATAADKIAVEMLVNTSQRLPAQQHLNIYKNSYVARLRECMKSQFSALAFALGEELFQAFADDYLIAHPSASYTLNELGKKFPAFLEATRPDANEAVKESWPDFMIELAHFEYRLSAIFDEQEKEERTVLPGAAADEFVLLPVFHLFHHRFPVCRYYLDFVAQKAPQFPFEGESYCVVLRKNYRLGLFEIKPAQFVFLTAMKEGKSVDEALDFTAEKFMFPPQEMQELWKVWRAYFIAAGFFVNDTSELRKQIHFNLNEIVP